MRNLSPFYTPLLNHFMTPDYTNLLSTIIELLRAILFWLSFSAGVLVFSLFGKRWFF